MNKVCSNIIKNKTANIYYEIYGEGEVIVFLHGNGENLEYFKYQIEYFSKKYKIIAIDSRGHGKSSKGKLKFDFWLFANDVIAVLNNLNINKVHVLGFSDGGNTALHLALKYPDRVKSLILNGSNFKPSGVKVLVQLPVLLEYYSLIIFSIFSKNIKERIDILNLMVNNPNLKEEDLNKIKIPTLVVVGDKDMIKEKHTHLIANLIENSEISIIPNSTHFVAMENPIEFNSVMERFLSKIIYK